MVDALDPGLIVLSNLFRDQLDRYGELEHLADEWAEMVAEPRGGRPHGPRAERRRPADRRPGPRRAISTGRAEVTYFGIEDDSQALPGLQHAHDAKHCRRCGAPYVYDRAFVGHLGHYRCPNCGADRPAPDIAATKIELDGMRGSRSRSRPPTATSSCELPLPGLYNVYNALAALSAALRHGRRPRRRPSRAWSAPRRPSAGSRPLEVAGQAGLHPPDQEPGGRERGDPHPGPRETSTTADGRAFTSGSPSTTGSLTAATSPGSGMPTSSSSPARSRA